MYMILWWKNFDNYLTCVHNENGSIKIFEKLEDADFYANEHICSNDMKVISGVSSCSIKSHEI